MLAVAGQTCCQLVHQWPRPSLTYYAVQKKENMHANETVQPFRVEIAEDAVEDLSSRLANARFEHPLPMDDRSTGIPSSELQSLIALWAEHDWRATEERLNALP
jgi:hypothetical protein